MIAALGVLAGAIGLAGWALSPPAGVRGRPGRVHAARAVPFSPAAVRGPARAPDGRPGASVAVLAAALLAVVSSAVVAGPGAGAVIAAAAAVGLAVGRGRRRQVAARQRAARAEAAPAVIDLLSACLLAGLNPYLALRRVAERSPDALRPELDRVSGELALGKTPGAALRAAAERSGLDELRAAAGALEAAERWGMPPAEALAARAEALRGRHRLRAEAEAGRAAVRLAFPLVFCFLPAFVLLTVVPTVAGALRALTP